MRTFSIAPAAEQDIESILIWTEEHSGEQARLRYEALLTQAILDVVRNPELLGSAGRPEIATAARTYHLIYSRNHVTREVGRVKQPRHFLLYRTTSDLKIEIGRVLHDSMDLPLHLPEEYRS